VNRINAISSNQRTTIIYYKKLVVKDIEKQIIIIKTMARKALSAQEVPVFEQIRRIDEHGNEYWSARDLSKALEYIDYRNFISVIGKAKEACRNSNHTVSDHFVDVNEMVGLGSGAERQVDSVKLSRYACYLIVQNADPSKEVIALGQTYFAVQTRLQEIRQMEEYNALVSEDEKRLFLRSELRRHNSQLAETAHHAGVIDAVDYAIFQNFGYKGLYGGLDAKTIRELGGTMPENLPSTESIKQVVRKFKSDEKKTLKNK
jgi:DNA-damage-inducible protein D